MVVENPVLNFLKEFVRIVCRLGVSCEDKSKYQQPKPHVVYRLEMQLSCVACGVCWMTIFVGWQGITFRLETHLLVCACFVFARIDERRRTSHQIFRRYLLRAHVISQWSVLLEGRLLLSLRTVTSQVQVCRLFEAVTSFLSRMLHAGGSWR